MKNTIPELTAAMADSLAGLARAQSEMDRLQPYGKPVMTGDKTKALGYRKARMKKRKAQRNSRRKNRGRK